MENKEEFLREFVGEILIEKVNLDKATLTEAVMFKERLLNDSISGYRKIIVDFSNCSYVDSSIVGALVVLLKKLRTTNGKLKVVIPKSESFQFFTITGLDRTFDLYNTIDEAIYSFKNS